MKTIENRTTIRKYSNRELSNTLLRELLARAEHTPTMGNLQLYSVVATRDQEMKRKLAPAHFGQPMVENAAVVLTFVPTSVVRPFGLRTEKETLVTATFFRS